jgi:guanylate cyclase
VDVRRLPERLADIGAHPQDTHDERLRAGALILASVLIALVSFVWVGTYLARDRPVSAAIPATYQVLTVVGLVGLARTKRFDVFRTTQMAAFLVLPALLQASLGGFAASSAMVIWALMSPLAAVAMLDVRAALKWLAAFLVVLLVLGVLDDRFMRWAIDLPSEVVVAFFVLNIAGLMLGTFVMLGYFVHQNRLAQEALEAERQRSERLLLNVLPAPIAERLKDRQGVIAEHHDAVTVLFADLVGFTEHTTEMPADDLVRLLDEIFSAFDRLVDGEGIEKIKTIGDAYMVAGGLPQPRPDHAQAVARVALAMQREVAVIGAARGLPWLAIRAGIDTGPAVAGVIGHRRFIYDLWGDTVNTASRMESHGVPGRVQLTARAAETLGGAFRVEPRGLVDVKGKGKMETFLLVDG